MPRNYAAARTKYFARAARYAHSAGDEMPMAGRVGTIYVILRFFFADIALPDHLARIIGIKGSHDDSAVENIQLASKIFIRIFFHVAHDASIQLIHIGKSLGY